MKLYMLFLALCLSIVLPACGDSQFQGESDKSGTTSANSTLETTELPKPRVEVPSRPPPKELVVKDLDQGSGRKASVGDKVAIQYVGANYKTGEEYYRRWYPTEPLSFRLGSEYVIESLEEGLAGMKVGGRRKMIIPSRLAYGRGAVVYVVELLAIE